MLWFLFFIGFIMTILGSLLFVYREYIQIGTLEFDGEDLGICMLIIGGILAGIMLLALGINWIITI